MVLAGRQNYKLVFYFFNLPARNGKESVEAVHLNYRNRWIL